VVLWCTAMQRCVGISLSFWLSWPLKATRQLRLGGYLVRPSRPLLSTFGIRPPSATVNITAGF